MIDAKKLGKTIRYLREQLGISQQQLAYMVAINRVSLTNVENGERLPKSDELKKYSDIFNMSIDELLAFHVRKIKNTNNNLDKQKFEKLVLYILNKCGIKPNVGKTVLYKLLYFCDFNFYEKYGKSISGMDYIKLPMGPAPYDFDKYAEDMMKTNKLLLIKDQKLGDYYQHKYIPNIIIDKSSFESSELEIIDSVIVGLSDFTAKEISDYSHEDSPWLNSDDLDIISYELVKNRNSEYSILEREKKKNSAFAEIKTSGMFDDLELESDLYEKYR